MKTYYNNSCLPVKKGGTGTRIRFAFLSVLLIIAGITLPVKKANAQSVPTISYASPQVYQPGSVIKPLKPTSSNVGTEGYSTPITINTGLSQPSGIAVDIAGNLYVSDLATNIVKEFPVGGGSPVIIGAGQFTHPEGLAVDEAGNVYTSGNTNGQVTEILKSNGNAVNLGSGFSTQYSDVAVDAAGNVYVTDYGNATSTLKKILKSNGSIVPIAAGRIGFTESVAIDTSTGNIYVADTRQGPIIIEASTGELNSVGNGEHEPPAYYAQGIAVNGNGSVFVSDQGHGTIVETDVTNEYTYNQVTGLTNPGQIACDAAGNVYFIDTGTETVQEIKPVSGYFINATPPGLTFDRNAGILSGTTPVVNLPPTNYTVTAYDPNGGASASAVINIAIALPALPTLSYKGPQTYFTATPISPLTPSTSGVAAPGYSIFTTTYGTGYNGVQTVAVDAAGNVYVSDSNNNLIKEIPAGGGSQFTFASTLVNGYHGVYGVAVDAKGNVYAAQSTSNSILKYPPGGGTPVYIGANLGGTCGLAVDAAGNVYVADVDDFAVEEILASNGNTITLQYLPILESPYGVAVDGAGNVYVAVTSNNTVEKLPAGGGTPVNIGKGFNQPYGIAVDGAGNVYVSDYGSKSIKMISVSGTTTTIATGFSNPQGIAISGAGVLYLADAGTNIVYQIVPTGGYYIGPYLPKGLVFNRTTGGISGTPSVVTAAQNYTVTGYNVAGGTAATVNIGVLAPVDITSVTRQDSALTNASAVTYKVVLSQPVTGLNPANFSVTTTGGITGASVSSVTGADSTYTVTVSTGTGDGTLTLNLANDVGVVRAINTHLPFAGPTYTIDKTAPQLTTLYITSNNPDNYATPVIGNTVTVYFGANEPITGISVSIDGHTLTPVLSGSTYAASYVMTAADPAGLVHYSLAFSDLAGNAVGPYNDVNDNIEFTLAAAVSSIKIQDPVNVITNAKTVTWRVTFTQDVTGVSASNFAIVSSGTATGTITGLNQVSASVYDVTAGSVSGDGSLGLNLTDQTSISPALISNVPYVGQTYTIDNTPPNVFFGNPSVLSTTTGPVTYHLYYGDAYLNTVTVTTSNITLNKTGTANGAVALTDSSGVYLVTISNITGSGTLSLTLAPGTATDLAGNIAAGYTSPNVIVFSADATLSNLQIGGGSVIYTPTFDKTVTSYNASVPNTTTSTTITPYLTNSLSTVTIGGTPVTPGQPYTVSSLNEGSNGFGIVVTAQDGTSTAYSLYITRDPSSVATLSSLIVSDGGNNVALTPTFDINQLSYNADVPNTTTSVSITPTVTDPTATLQVGGNTVASGAAIPFNLNIGANTFTAAVIAQDGSTGATYNILITRDKTPQVITFSALPEKIADEADFAPGAISTNSTIPITYSSDNTAVATIVNGQIHLVGAGIVDITASQAGNDLYLPAQDVVRALKVDPGPVIITAMSRQDAAVTSSEYLAYTVTFNGSVSGLQTGNFSVVTTGGITGAYVSAVTGSDSSYTVTIFTGTGNGTETLNMINATGVPPGVSTPLPFAGDIYTINKKTNTGLAGLVLSPTSAITEISSNSAQINYTTSVSATTNSVEIKPTLSDTAATITVDGQAVTSGSWSQSITLNTDGTPTIVTTVVTAQDGVTQKSYVISISKSGSSNIVLEGLQMNPNAFLTTVSNTTTQTNYTTSVSSSTTSVEIKPTLSDPTATVTVNGEAVTSGNWSQSITLNTDGMPTTVTTVVTADNGQQKSYVISISKNGSSDVILEGLQLNPNSTLTQTSSTPTQINYSTSVSMDTTAVEIKPTASDPTAGITVNGQAVTSGNWSQPITLNTDGTPTIVTTVLTAGDGTQKSYVVSISKNGSSDSILEGLLMVPFSPLVQTSSTSTQINYSTTVPYGTGLVEVIPYVNGPAYIKVNGIPVSSGSWSLGEHLNTDGTPTILTIVVTSENGTQKSYVISVTIGGESLAKLPQEPARLQLVTDVVVHQAVTPDGDGINDYLRIDGIDQYPDNKLVVLNPGGAKVYEVSGYDNSTKIFDGHSSGNRSLLQPGTYYYMLDYKKDNTTQHKTGYFVLKY